MWSDHPYQQGCKNAFPCGICDLPKHQILKIKGIVPNTTYKIREIDFSKQYPEILNYIQNY